MLRNVIPSSVPSESLSLDDVVGRIEQATSITFMKSSARDCSMISSVLSVLIILGRFLLRILRTSWIACLLLLDDGSSAMISSRRWAGMSARAL